jgi:hypothetical protein
VGWVGDEVGYGWVGDDGAGSVGTGWTFVGDGRWDW